MFSADCVSAMEKFDRNDVTIFQACDLLDKYADDDDPNKVIEFVNNTISHIDADHDKYLKLLRMLKAGATEEEVIAYMNEPGPPIFPAWFRKLLGWK